MNSTIPLLRRVTPNEVMRVGRSAVDPDALRDAKAIIEDVRARGRESVLFHAGRFGELQPGEQLVLDRSELQASLESVDSETVNLLRRIGSRIEDFAAAQRESIRDLSFSIPGGRAGHRIIPVESAGCYAPAGRHPLPSSVLMTAVTARVAGCERVVVASPSRNPVMLAAAAIAGADEFLAVGGAHAIAAMAYGIDELPCCDVIVGPGNKWVTAAKHLVSDSAGIDMLAGPSELLIIADETADPDIVAADLLAQAEHDDEAIPMLVTISAQVADDVERSIAMQLERLSTAATARRALRNGFTCVVSDVNEACRMSDSIAAEHVEIHTRNSDEVESRLKHAGGVFVGSASAEVLGDYGAGPNHTLPTRGSARYSAGLSVMHFLRLRTWLRLDDSKAAASLLCDAADLSRVEGLEGHCASARIRTMSAN